MLEQVSNDLREEIPVEERLGLKKIPLPTPPLVVAAFINAVGSPLPHWLDRGVDAALFASFTFLCLNALVPPDTTGGDLQPLWKALTFGLDRWAVAWVSALVMALLSYRVWAVDVRDALENGSDTGLLEAYG